jgi:hypothetical protein
MHESHRINHSKCSHPRTPKGRAACRKIRNGKDENGNPLSAAGTWTRTGFLLNGHNEYCTYNALEQVEENACDAGVWDRATTLIATDLIPEWGITAAECALQWLTDETLTCRCSDD